MICYGWHSPPSHLPTRFGCERCMCRPRGLVAAEASCVGVGAASGGASSSSSSFPWTLTIEPGCMRRGQLWLVRVWRCFACWYCDGRQVQGRYPSARPGWRWCPTSGALGYNRDPSSQDVEDTPWAGSDSIIDGWTLLSGLKNNLRAQLVQDELRLCSWCYQGFYLRFI